MTLTSEKAKEMGKQSGEARRAQKDEKITLRKVLEELPALTDLDSVKRRLEIIANWTAAGLITGAASHAISRAHEIWLRADAEGKADQVKGEIEQRIAQLEGELARRKDFRFPRSA